MFLFVADKRLLCMIVILSKLNEITMENSMNSDEKSKKIRNSENLRLLLLDILWSINT